ncbi:hypothetical protein [Sinorhizobium sp. RAC02]|uniref:hypothetical protein n=1 Tax=Sinorhizobium sp. RAC02 TaxID=1842534 RepID=UPI0012376F88|nr:hypothetical protein [Sinorhizobium sp. RAC02]
MEKPISVKRMTAPSSAAVADQAAKLLAALNRQENSDNQEQEEPCRGRRYAQERKPRPHIVQAWPLAIGILRAEKRQSAKDDRRPSANDHRHGTFRSGGSPDHTEQVDAGNRSDDQRGKKEKNAHCVPFARTEIVGGFPTGRSAVRH